jgi:hypothetical protein
MFAIIIEDINKHIQKQITAKLNSIKTLLIEFQQFADVFLKKASDTLLEYREKYDYYIKLEDRAKLP